MPPADVLQIENDDLATMVDILEDEAEQVNNGQ